MEPLQVLQNLKTKFASLPKSIQTEIVNRFREIDKTEKQIPFNNFFVEFVEESQLLSTSESKALYQHVKTSNKGFTFAILQQIGLMPADPEPKKT